MPNAMDRELAVELHLWFRDVRETCDRTLFATGDPPHLQAAVMGVILRNARLLSTATPDTSGELYSPTCLLLAALCRKRSIVLQAEHWYAGVDNVASLRRNLARVGGNAAFGIDLGTPAAIFLALTREALSDAGLLRETTFLDEESRSRAEGLVINWALRFLLAYSIESSPSKKTEKGVRDLAWLRGQMERVLAP